MRTVQSARVLRAALPAFLLAATAQAAPLTVTSLADAGAGSLRDTIAAAAAGDTIGFAPGLGGVVALAAPLAIAKNLTIVGNGAVALDGQDAVLVLSVAAGADVLLDGIVVQRGNGAQGGGIYSAGHLTLSHCIVRDNHASAGGGLYVDNVAGAGYSLVDTFVIDNEARGGGGGILDSGPLASTITRSEISGNVALGVGGGIAMSAGHTLHIDHGSVVGNQALGASSRGGGLDVGGAGTLDMAYSTIAANKAFYGGGLFVEAAGTATLRGVLIDGNAAESYGGGSFVFGGSLDADNSTVTKNLSLGGGGGLALQNASSHAAQATLSSCTVAANQAATSGGGLGVISGSLAMQYTLVGGNTAPASPDLQGAFASAGLNLVQTRGTSSGYAGSDLPDGSDPKLDSLAFNGGPTNTLALLAGSAASGAIPSSKCRAIPLDQRGFRRLAATCDIGAFQTGAIGDTLFANGFE